MIVISLIKDNRPYYMVLAEERFQELLKVQQEADHQSLRVSLEDLKAGRINRYENTDSLMQQLECDDDL